MTDQTSAAPSRAPKIAGGLTIAALIASAVVSVEPQTTASEGEILKAYPDIGGVPTICRGHTGPEVHLGMVATHEQCRAWYRADMAKAMTAAIAITPTLVEQLSALKAAGDFTLNAGPGWWKKSPMSAAFADRQWAAGCKAFTGYIVAYKASKVILNRNCRVNSKGILYCDSPGLVNRRTVERTICLFGL